MWPRIPMKIFDGTIYVPRFIVIWNETKHANKTCGVCTACYICGYDSAVAKLSACESELKNATGTYCGSKDK